MAFSRKRKLALSVTTVHLSTALCTSIVFIVPALFLLGSPSNPISSCSTTSLSSSSTATSTSPSFSSGDLRTSNFAWNGLTFSNDLPPVSLRIAVFCRKWPVSASPGGMERHALTLHSVLARRGHRIHVFTSPVIVNVSVDMPSLKVHFHKGKPGSWTYRKAWEDFLEENKREPFDVIHTESVSLPNFLAKDMPNVVVSWQGIAMEGLYSYIYQDLALRQEKEPFSPTFSKTVATIIPSLLNEIR